MKPVMKAPGSVLLKLIYYQPLSTFVFKFNLRRYIQCKCPEAAPPPPSPPPKVLVAPDESPACRSYRTPMVRWCRLNRLNPY
jgi:hypothetical protein